MIDFGYKINADRQIDYDRNDRRLALYILENEPTFSICISCGTCTATCSAGNYTYLNLREMIVLIKRGEAKNIKTDIEKCMLCGKCQLACPRGVNTRNIILTIHRAIERLDF
jgi:heterodisulfide reductase subunit C